MQKPLVICTEDNPDDNLLFQTACRRANASFEVIFVNDGVKAIECLASLKHADGSPRLPDLLLLDLKMPRKNGFEVLAWARSNLDKSLPIAVFTSSEDHGDIRRAYQGQIDWYLMKPIDFDELVKAAQGVSDWIDKRDADILRRLSVYRRSNLA